MKKFLLASMAVVCLLLAACSKPGPRTIEMPPVTASNNISADITRVELTDSATVVNLHVNFRPGWWIRLAETTRLEAGGKEYALKNAEGIALGEQFTMPESGEADFTLAFEPLPFDTESFDFTEGTPDGWVLCGVGISGRNDAPDYEAMLPKEVRNAGKDDADIEPVLEVAPTDIRFHMLAYRPEYGNKLSLYVKDATGNKPAAVNLDENGEGILSTTICGTADISITPDGMLSKRAVVTVAPGETTDVYVSPAIMTDYFREVVRKDNGEKNYPYVYTNGRYAALSRYRKDIAGNDFLIIIGNRSDWQMNSDEYIADIAATRDSLLDAVAAADCPDNIKKYITTGINAESLEALNGSSFLRGNRYHNANPGALGIPDSVKAIVYEKIEPEKYAFAKEWIDGNDLSYILPSVVEYIGGAEGMIPEVRKAFAPYLRKAKTGKLTDADIAEFNAAVAGKADEKLAGFYVSSLKALDEQIKKAQAEALRLMTANPEVADDKLFDAIVAPYKGKVVLVDLWNTWCGPCRAALKANEPLKTGEFADDDIVWLYIADESSDMAQYAQMIPDIKGVHHMVNAEQIALIRKRFEVDGIPYYILVDRDGKATGHPDFRNHDTLVSTLKSAL